MALFAAAVAVALTALFTVLVLAANSVRGLLRAEHTAALALSSTLLLTSVLGAVLALLAAPPTLLAAELLGRLPVLTTSGASLLTLVVLLATGLLTGMLPTLLALLVASVTVLAALLLAVAAAATLALLATAGVSLLVATTLALLATTLLLPLATTALVLLGTHPLLASLPVAALFANVGVAHLIPAGPMLAGLLAITLPTRLLASTLLVLSSLSALWSLVAKARSLLSTALLVVIFTVLCTAALFVGRRSPMGRILSCHSVSPGVKSGPSGLMYTGRNVIHKLLSRWLNRRCPMIVKNTIMIAGKYRYAQLECPHENPLLGHSSSGTEYFDIS